MPDEEKPPEQPTQSTPPKPPVPPKPEAPQNIDFRGGEIPRRKTENKS
jgi:hypothetical protein